MSEPEDQARPPTDVNQSADEPADESADGPLLEEPAGDEHENSRRERHHIDEPHAWALRSRPPGTPAT